MGTPKTLEEIRAQCEREGLSYVRSGDGAWVKGGGAVACYNPQEGYFAGSTPEGVAFHSLSRLHEKEPWFQSLVSFFHKS